MKKELFIIILILLIIIILISIFANGDVNQALSNYSDLETQMRKIWY